ncbi:hypothetical protein B0T11DRAFT_347732 [Plectosphaerella cucumerina]|uniref:Methylenetetrahydrofolate dehydrogenase n=1 Tax=Plectosphaerella cucumerina TaxID=40658 RepID=A0A8K0TTF0_9PEZI|nr:hypothetical protein B0T11DRAFT_347732 [Plectosphaerella cucumerina]
MDFLPKTSSSPSSTGHRIVVRSADAAESIIREARAALGQACEPCARRPTLLGLLANEEPSTLAYVKFTRKVFQANGFQFSLQSTTGLSLERQIEEANMNDAIDGILVYYPARHDGAMTDRYYQRLVAPDKDVEGLCSEHMQAFYHEYLQLGPGLHHQAILPCTALAVCRLLESSGVYSSTSWGERLSRKTITVINRSNVVGKPLAALLVSEGATVFSVDPTGVAQVLKQRIGRGGRRYQVTDLPGADLEACLRVSDVILSGVYDRSFQIPTELVKVGAACVDFSSVENFEKSAITLRASMYAYSIGQVVVAALFENFTRLLLNKERLGCRCKDDLCRWALAAGGSDNDVRFSGRDENVTECCASRPGEQEQTG